MSVAFTRGMQGDDLREGVLATAKHFLGHVVTEGRQNMAATASLCRQAPLTAPRRARGWLALPSSDTLCRSPATMHETGACPANDGNPNLMKWTTFFGVGGSSFISGRPDNRFGLAYFHIGVSSALKDELAPVNLKDESGVEVFYNVAMTPWFRITDVEEGDPNPERR